MKVEPVIGDMEPVHTIYATANSQKEATSLLPLVLGTTAKRLCVGMAATDREWTPGLNDHDAERVSKN